jgi:site-specific recombinase XerC
MRRKSQIHALWLLYCPVATARDVADEPVKPVPVGPSIAATFADYMREHAHRRTQAQIQANLERFLDHVRLKKTASVSSITKPLISAWKAKRLTEVSPTTAARNLRLLSHYCAWLSNEGHVSVDPSAKIGGAVRAQRAAKVRRKDFTPEQMRLISDALVKRRQTARTKHLDEYFWICQVVLFSRHALGGSLGPLDGSYSSGR